MPYYGRVAEERHQLAGHTRERWRGVDVLLGNVREALDEGGQAAVWVDEGLGGVDGLGAYELDRANFDDLVALRREPGGFEVKCNPCIFEGRDAMLEKRQSRCGS